MKCPACGNEVGLPPVTCQRCGAVVKECPCCGGFGVVVTDRKRV
jgi:hypothetical protein